MPYKSKIKKRSYQRKYMARRRSNIGLQSKYDNQENVSPNVRPGSKAKNVRPVKAKGVRPGKYNIVTPSKKKRSDRATDLGWGESVDASAYDEW